MDLVHLDLDHQDLEHLDLDHLDLDHQDLGNLDLIYLDLDHLYLRNLGLEHLDLDHLDLYHLDLNHLVLDHLDLDHLDLEDLDLSYLDLDHLDLARDFRVCVRRTEAADRCRLKGDGVLRADMDALHLLDKAGDILYSWPYRYLRRFGRDKSTFSFEAGRRCDSGEGSFEFDTKDGNFLFQTVETAINLQKISFPSRQTSGGGQGSPEAPQILNLPPPPVNPPLAHSRTLPLPQPRGQVPQPPPAQEADGVYSMVSEAPGCQMIHHKDSESFTPSQQQQQQRPQLSHLEPPVDKMLTAVKSLTLDPRGVPTPRKNQVKMISSCPLPNASPELAPGPGSNPNLDQMYSQISLSGAAGRSIKKEKKKSSVAPPCTPPLSNKESDYSLPFDTITTNVMSDILSCHQGSGNESGADPLYDSIDEMKIRNISISQANSLRPTYRKVDHIYDEPEGCAATTSGPTPITALYDDPEEMRGDAWRIMGTAADPKGHEYPYNPREDDYAVPKRPQKAFISTQVTGEEEEELGREEELEGEVEVTEEQEDSPYNNVMLK
ncbi:uncharacterized protein dok2 isoform X2 [Melanotaenia boesemani]|uniref:uncharacterized protein dok2 isoform X2 n=1 Tax=Melanotaenia boesemani TaxID=1250792 RepID=UPI001C05346D|nr:uncharacterized protein dok2 isoform X2 [Melanotaenia boesemani]